MDQTKNNLERIRAFDAEEGEWRTINGAHVLIKNGRIAGGAGGAMNGQPFRGGSLKKMQSGSKGSKFNENRERASIREAVKSPLYGTVPAGLNVERSELHLHYDPNRRYTVTKGRQGRRGRNDDPRRFNVLEGARPISTNWYGTIFEADHKHLTVPRYPLGPYEGTARLEPSKAELAARARSLKERRPDLFKAGRTASPASRLTNERGGAAAPQQSAAYNTGKKRALEHIKRLTNEGHEDPEALAAVKAEASSYVKKWRDIAKRNPGDETAEKQLGWYETLEKGWGDMLNSVNRSKSREAERGGAAAPQQSAPHAIKIGRMQPGSTAVNAGNEAKRLDHNARVYHRTARRAREAYNAKLDKAGGEPNAIEQKKSAYKAKSDENVSRRDQAAASAKERLAKLRQLAKSLKARNPNAFKG